MQRGTGAGGTDGETAARAGAVYTVQCVPVGAPWRLRPDGVCCARGALSRERPPCSCETRPADGLVRRDVH